MTAPSARRWPAVPLVIAALAVLVAGCNKAKGEKAKVQTVAASRQNIIVSAEATGVVEPINVVEVKSKAGGQIVQMPVETGTQVKPGDLMVQVDTRDVKNQYEQAAADVRAAEASVAVAESQKKRSDDLFSQRIITAQEHETTTLTSANAQAQLVRSRASLDLAKQRLEDATVRAPVTGTVIEKDVALGQVITSATGAFGGGTTLLKMADLEKVRVRALVNETDIGQVQPGQIATITVDAFPDRRFQGTVEKIEPQAVVQQSVTMFPVLVSVSNRDRLLMPGMNGEVSVLVEERDNVLAIPNDAIRNPREAIVAAVALGLDPAAVQKKMQEQFSMGGGQGGPARAPGAGAPAQVIISRGEVALAPEQGAQAPSPKGSGSQMPAVTPEQCARIAAVLARKPAAQATLDSLRTLMMSGQADRQAIFPIMQKVYGDLGIDPMVASACRRAQPQGAGTMTRQSGAVTVRQGGSPTQAGTPEISGAPRGRSRSGLVFVAENGTYTPRIVRLGVANFDYTEVVSGIKEGEQVAMLAAATLQAQRQQNLDRFKGMTGGGVPGMQRQGGAAGAATPRPTAPRP
ncbi:MAG: efflux RND transporter periplasmic adaptor subunit [Gemmatimonadota bacterium]|nr:efflux RND transporter periplasmic adaptor subunit [Gemmatimonadota bacterium]